MVIMAPGGYKSQQKGKSAEYKLMKILQNANYFVMRAPGSGARAKHYPYVDVIAIKKGKVLLFEVKAREFIRSIYIDSLQYQKLKEAEELSGGTAYIAVYIQSTKVWYLFTLDKLRQKDSVYMLGIKKYNEALSLDVVI